jgi:S1-C subfamily serine protease
MPLRITCPSCKNLYTVPDKAQGRQFKCKGCGAMLAVRGAAATTAAIDEAIATRPERAAPPPLKQKTPPDKSPPRREPMRQERRDGRPSWLVPTLIAGSGGLVLLLALIGFLLFGRSSAPAPEPTIAANNTPAPAPAVAPAPPQNDVQAEAKKAEERKPAEDKKAPVEEKKPAAPEPDPLPLAKAATGEQIYQRLLKSTVWIVANQRVGLGSGAMPKDGAKPPQAGAAPPGMRTGPMIATGTGSLIDRKHRLVITNVHVVGDDPEWVKLHFPQYAGGELVAKRDAYQNQPGIAGKVVAKEERADLALVQLERIPDNVRVLPVARIKAKPGQQVHSLGNPGASTALWIYSPGRVRQVFQDRWSIRDPAQRKTHLYDAMKLETDSPINPGDSGGPLVNDRAVMVGVAHAGDFKANNFSFFIDASEVRALVEKYYRSVGETWSPEPEGSLGEVNLAQLSEWIKKLSHFDQAVRVQAVQTVGNLGPDATLAFVPLFKCLKDDDVIVRRTASDAIENVPPHKEDLAMLTKVCQDPQEPAEIRAHAVKAIGRLGAAGKAGLPMLLTLASASKDELQDATLAAMESIGVTPQDAPALAKLLKASPTPHAKRQVLTILARLGSDAKPAAAEIAPLLKTGDRPTKLQAVRTLESIGGVAKEAVSGLSEAIKDTDKDVAINAAAALMKMGETKYAVPFFSSLLANKSVAPVERLACVRVLMALGKDARAAVKDLVSVIEDDQLGPAAVEALVRIGPSASASIATKMVAMLKDPQAADARLDCIVALDRIGVTSTDIQKALLAIYQRDPNLENRAAASLVGNKLAKKR